MIARSVALVLLVCATSASAQTSGRFTFQPIDGGFMRLDSETGHVSQCVKIGDGFTCRSVADDRAAMLDEIDRLKRENDELRKMAGKPSDPGVTGKLQLPSEEEIDKAMSLFEKMMRRMMRTFREDGTEPNRL